MFSGCARRSTPQPPPPAATSNRPSPNAAPQPSQPDAAQPFPSAYGDRQGVSHVPLLVYGYHAPAVAKMISDNSTLSCLAVEKPDDLAKVLDGRPLAGCLALSPTDKPGEAGQAIAMFRAQYPKKMALYYSWSYNVERASAWAVEYHAQGVVMPGSDVAEMLGYIIKIMERTDRGKPAPKTAQEHIALLKQYMPQSPFWKLQKRDGVASY